MSAALAAWRVAAAVVGLARAPAAARHAVAQPPPGPTRPTFWRSPLRGPWLTSVLGLALLATLPLVAVTGLLSYAAYNPDLAGNDLTPGAGPLRALLPDWPTEPVWLYRLNQGVHVVLGLALVPVVLGKLWSVVPKLFTWPPVRSPAHAAERVSLLALVGGGLVVFATGVLNIQLEYAWPGSFYPLHLYSGVIFTAAVAAHVVLKLPTAVRAVRSRRPAVEMATPTAATVSEPPDDHGLVAPAPDPPTVSRRGALALVGGGSALLVALSVGQSLGGRWAATALLAPRGRAPEASPAGFPVNKTAQAARIDPARTGEGWRLELRGGPDVVRLSRADLLALPQRTAMLPIACVEGWSTTDQEWRGVRLRDLAALAGVPDPASVHVVSLQERGAFRDARLRRNQVADGDALLALAVNGADLPLDHGYPARVIVPANPGVHCTKWVASMEFEA